MQVCVTGANGFIGRQLVEALIKDGHSIKILTRKDKSLFPTCVEIVNGDLTRSDCPLTQFVKGCEVMFHCAGEIRDVNVMRLLHVDGTKHLINTVLEECLLTHKKLHWVQLSSCGAYGPPVDKLQIDRVVTETSPTRPDNEYESTKTIADNLLIEACKNGLMTFSILRPSNVFGATMSGQSLRTLIDKVRCGRFFYLGKPGAIATYVHVKDVVKALLTLASDSRAKGEIYNLSNDCVYEELIGKIASLLHVPVPSLRIPQLLVGALFVIREILLGKQIYIPKSYVLMPRTRYSTKKIETELDFVFSMPMPDAIVDLINTVG